MWIPQHLWPWTHFGALESRLLNNLTRTEESGRRQIEDQLIWKRVGDFCLCSPVLFVCLFVDLSLFLSFFLFFFTLSLSLILTISIVSTFLSFFLSFYVCDNHFGGSPCSINTGSAISRDLTPLPQTHTTIPDRNQFPPRWPFRSALQLGVFYIDAIGLEAIATRVEYWVEFDAPRALWLPSVQGGGRRGAHRPGGRPRRRRVLGGWRGAVGLPCLETWN